MLPRATPLHDALTPLQRLVARRWRPQWVCHECTHRQQPWRRASSTSSARETSPQKPYYVTTPIFYVNAAPHVGHMYTMILADVLKRWAELKGRKAILLTGTDEHGMKIQHAAENARVEPKEFCDQGAEIFKTLAGRVDMSNDHFIRTTERKHKEGVQYAWQMLEDRGLLYESKHEGWYSVSDETFYTQTSVQPVVDPPTGRKMLVSKETGSEVEWTSERNYRFRMSAFQERLLDFYKQNPEFIVPKTRMKDMVSEVESGLRDLSVSRSMDRLTWGIPVPTDSSQTIYVWLDALLNYATGVGYPFVPGKESVGGWAPDVQVVGKDIVRFHGVYWPAFLMALDLPLPKQILTHAHWTIGKHKMSKSTGNVVNPFFALERFGIDPLRWYLVMEGGIADDADYDNLWIIDKYKNGLKNSLGGLTTRIMRGKSWDVQKAVQRFAHPNSQPDRALTEDDASQSQTRQQYEQLTRLPSAVDTHMSMLYPNQALRTIMAAVAHGNVYISHQSPWTLTKEISLAASKIEIMDQVESTTEREAKVKRLQEEVDVCVYLCAETLRLTGIMLQPFIPSSAKRMLDMLGVAPERRTFEWAKIGSDSEYGVPFHDLGEGKEGVLFPPLTSDF